MNQIKEGELLQPQALIRASGGVINAELVSLMPKKEILTPLKGCKGMVYMMGKMNDVIINGHRI
jgi:hypothetical protein